ncbi:uncharacterized protein A1O9_08974, partial [Exophiala aquamarina CBS 119918]
GPKPNVEKATFEQQLREIRIGRIKLELLRSTLQDLPYHHVELKPESQNLTCLASRRHPTILEDETMNGMISDHSTLPAPAKAQDRDQQISSHTGDLLALITAYLNLGDETNGTNQLAFEDAELLADEISRFKTDITAISSAVSTRLLALESSLISLASLTAVESSSPPAPTTQLVCIQDSNGQTGSLISTLTPQTTHLSQLRGSALPNCLATLTQNLHAILRSQAHQLQSSLLRLESSKHGVQSRHAQSRAAFLATVAATMDLKAQVLVLEKQIVVDAGGQETREWVKMKLDALTDQESGLEDRIMELSGVLAEYEAVDPELRVLKRLGARYREVEGEMDLVKRDIERLEREEE